MSSYGAEARRLEPGRSTILIEFPKFHFMIFFKVEILLKQECPSDGAEELVNSLLNLLAFRKLLYDGACSVSDF